MNFPRLYLAWLVCSTFVACACFRASWGWSTFGYMSLLTGIPLGILSIGPINYAFNPPPTDPVGGNGMAVGLVLMLMIPFAVVAVPTWIAAICFEK